MVERVKEGLVKDCSKLSPEQTRFLSSTDNTVAKSGFEVLLLLLDVNIKLEKNRFYEIFCVSKY